MTSRICAALLTLSLSLPAAAQDVVDSTVSDLNGDGLRERFTLLDYGTGTVDLIIEDAGPERITAAGIAWMGGIGQEAELDLAVNGSVRLMSMNESIGRNRWHLTLTIAYRGGAYMIAGYTYSHYDTLNLDDAGTCDLNLLNGNGFLTVGTGPKQAIRHDVAQVPVTEWKETAPIPEVCRTWER